MMEKYNINQTTLKILGLYASDYTKSLHLREVARDTKTDVKTIQLQMKRLERKNILSGIIKGRNKEYRLNLNNSATRYFMILAETFRTITYFERNFIIKKIINEIGNKIEGSIILFGSFAREEATKESDIDLFAIVEKKSDKDIMNEVSGLIGREINVKFASKKQFLKGLENNDPLIREVVLNHIILKNMDEFCDIMWRYHARQ